MRGTLRDWDEHSREAFMVAHPDCCGMCERLDYSAGTCNFLSIYVDKDEMPCADYKRDMDFSEYLRVKEGYD